MTPSGEERLNAAHEAILHWVQRYNESQARNSENLRRAEAAEMLVAELVTAIIAQARARA